MSKLLGFQSKLLRIQVAVKVPAFNSGGDPLQWTALLFCWTTYHGYGYGYIIGLASSSSKCPNKPQNQLHIVSYPSHNWWYTIKDSPAWVTWKSMNSEMYNWDWKALDVWGSIQPVQWQSYILVMFLLFDSCFNVFAIRIWFGSRQEVIPTDRVATHKT